MVLMKRNFLIKRIDDHRDQKVKVTVRFFNIDDGVIHTTDKTEIKIDDEVIIYYFLVEN